MIELSNHLSHESEATLNDSLIFRVHAALQYVQSLQKCLRWWTLHLLLRVILAPVSYTFPPSHNRWLFPTVHICRLVLSFNLKQADKMRCKWYHQIVPVLDLIELATFESFDAHVIEEPMVITQEASYLSLVHIKCDHQ